MSEKGAIAVIGAGPAGVTAAYQLSKYGKYSIDLFDAGSAVGGMAKTLPIMNQLVDIGPHRFFSNDPRVNRLWREVVGKDFEMVNRLTRIFYRGKFFFYPIKPFNALLTLGGFEATRCILSYVHYKVFPLKDDNSFASWVINRFGERLFQIFFKSYTEKLWGIGCNELDADFAGQRIKKLSLFEAVKNAFFSKGNKHKTLIDQFAYPLYGTGTVYRKMCEIFKRNGGQLHLNQEIQGVAIKDSCVVGIKMPDGSLKAYDHVVSTMPLTSMVMSIAGAPDDVRDACAKLRYRNTIMVYIKVDKNNLFPDQWLYLHMPELKSGRMANFRNWSTSLYGSDPGTILALEYWCYDRDSIWKETTDTDLIELATEELRFTGLLGNAKILGGHVCRIAKSYPVYDGGYKSHLLKIEDYLHGIADLHPIGRYGAFKYNNQDHSILMGILAAENIAEGTSHNLWEINTDYEYQETSKIDNIGLVEGRQNAAVA